MARSDNLADVVEALREIPEFLAGWLAHTPGGDSWVSERLDLDRRRLERLLVCRSPRPSTFQADVQRIAALIEVNPNSLASTLREGAALAALATAGRMGADLEGSAPSAGFLVAARDTFPETIRRGAPEDVFIRRLAEELRARAPQDTNEEPDIGALVAWTVPLALVVLPKLSLATAHDWLRERGVELGFGDRGRPLRGLLLAWRGNGLIFVDGDLPEAERRFTAAHELGHFLLDYREPRGHLLRRAPDLLEVLDGHRGVTTQDRARAALEQVKLGVHTHLLTRDSHGDVAWDVGEGEGRSSRFALELLSPWSAARAVLKRLPGGLSWRDRLERAASDLEREFRLPADPARVRAKEILYSIGMGPDFLER